MTRSDRIKKLGNAIKAYRGAYDDQTGIWKRRPQADKLDNIKLWLQRLGMTQAEITEAVQKIDGFKHTNEFRDWIAGL